MGEGSGCSNDTAAGTTCRSQISTAGDGWGACCSHPASWCPACDAPPVETLGALPPCSTAEADIERLNKDAEVAPHVQDDFDIQARQLRGREEGGACGGWVGGGREAGQGWDHLLVVGPGARGALVAPFGSGSAHDFGVHPFCCLMPPRRRRALLRWLSSRTGPRCRRSWRGASPAATSRQGWGACEGQGREQASGQAAVAVVLVGGCGLECVLHHAAQGGP